MIELKNSVAVVTGAGSRRGIGRAVAALLQSRGVRLVLADFDSESLAATVDELSAGGDVVGIRTDVSDRTAVMALADGAYEAFGRVDIAYLNAGIPGGASFFDDDLDAWERVLRVNLLGVLYGIKAFLPRMASQGGRGHILATSSGAGAIGTMYATPDYALAKSAVVSLMESLYGTLRDAGIDIATTVVLPPLTASNLAGSPEIMDRVQQGLQAGGVPARVVQPEQVAQVVLEAIETRSFWANPTPEQDKRIFDGDMEDVISWEVALLAARQSAIAHRTAPDGYLWSGKFS